MGYKSYTTIQKWEMGVSQPPLDKLVSLAKLYSVYLDDLVYVDLEFEDLNPKITEAIDMDMAFDRVADDTGMGPEDFRRLLEAIKKINHSSP